MASNGHKHVAGNINGKLSKNYTMEYYCYLLSMTKNQKHVKSELSGPRGDSDTLAYSIKSSNFENAAHDEPFAIRLVNELVQSASAVKAAGILACSA